MKMTEILQSYDCIGFDLDNTILEYNVPLLSELIFQCMADFLIQQKGYPPIHIKLETGSAARNFLQRGLALDLERGNIVKISEVGKVLRACHGSKSLSQEEIKCIYGENEVWQEAVEYTKDPFQAWNGPLGDKIRCLLDYFDQPISLLFARVVDSIDFSKSGTPYFNAWLDIWDGLNYIYGKGNFGSDIGGYFSAVKAEPSKYLIKCADAVISWLKDLKKDGKILFLMTGSAIDYATFTANYAIGPSWKDLFDVIVSFSGKPAFFSQDRAFMSLNGFMEGEPCKLTRDTQIVSRGNWKELYQLFIERTEKATPRAVYVGDNMLQDVLAPHRYGCCDAIAVCNEIAPPLLSSPVWGPYMEDEATPTFWGNLIKTIPVAVVKDMASLVLEAREDV